MQNTFNQTDRPLAMAHTCTETGHSSVMFLAALSVYAEPTGSGPLDNVVNVLKTCGRTQKACQRARWLLKKPLVISVETAFKDRKDAPSEALAGVWVFDLNPRWIVVRDSIGHKLNT